MPVEGREEGFEGLGSTARAVLRAGTVDTLIAREETAPQRAPALRPITVATDFHPPSEVAAQRAVALTKAWECSLSVIHVVDPSLWYDPGVEPSDEFLVGRLQEEIQDRLARFNREHLQGRASEVIDMIDGAMGGVGAAAWLASHPTRAVLPDPVPAPVDA